MERAGYEVVLALVVDFHTEDVTSEQVEGTVVFQIVRVAVSFNDVSQVVETVRVVDADLFAEFVIDESRVDGLKNADFEVADFL